MTQTDPPPRSSAEKKSPPARPQWARIAFNAGVLFLVMGVTLLGLRTCGLLGSAAERLANEYRLQGATVGLTEIRLMDDLARLTGYKGFSTIQTPDFLQRSEIDSFSWTAPPREIIPELRSLPSLKKLYLYKTELTPELIASLKSLNRLKVLQLPNSKATDETLAALCQSLENCPDLYCLYLGETQVTESGLQALKPLKSLVDVRFQSPHLSNATISMRDIRTPARVKIPR